MTQANMSFIGHLFAIVFGVILASAVAGIVIALGIFGPQWPAMSGDIGERVYFWGTAVIATSFTGAMAFLPMLVLITLAESFKVRSLLVHLAAGAALMLLGYYGSVAPASYEESIDHAPPPVSRAAEVAAAAGVAFGFTYWLIAGRTAGRWRERRTPPPLPPEARRAPELARPRIGDPGATS